MTKPKSFVAQLDSTGCALLLGGVKRTQSSRFASYADAASWLDVAREANEEAGRHCIGSIFQSNRKAEIAAQESGK